MNKSNVQKIKLGLLKINVYPEHIMKQLEMIHFSNLTEESSYTQDQVGSHLQRKYMTYTKRSKFRRMESSCNSKYE